jgi:hypothetical protein
MEPTTSHGMGAPAPVGELRATAEERALLEEVRAYQYLLRERARLRLALADVDALLAERERRILVGGAS